MASSRDLRELRAPDSLEFDAMKRPHPDARYYNCAPSDNHGGTACRGKMIVIGYEPLGKKQAVYECPVCKRKAGEASLLYAYNQLRKRD